MRLSRVTVSSPLRGGNLDAFSFFRLFRPCCIPFSSRSSFGLDSPRFALLTFFSYFLSFCVHPFPCFKFLFALMHFLPVELCDNAGFNAVNHWKPRPRPCPKATVPGVRQKEPRMMKTRIRHWNQTSDVFSGKASCRNEIASKFDT